MKVYVDTSFLVSLYAPDANSAAAARVIEKSKNIYVVSTLTELEAVNALELRVFRKEILPAQAGSSLGHLEADLRGGVFQLIPLEDECFGRAQQISRQMTARLGTRTADLLHVAVALESESEYLYSFDRQQRKLAQSLKLKLNPFAV
jgi:predicted nucleic acid-binding protein